jgi:hypothetical protein
VDQRQQAIAESEDFVVVNLFDAVPIFSGEPDQLDDAELRNREGFPAALNDERRDDRECQRNLVTNGGAGTGTEEVDRAPIRSMLVRTTSMPTPVPCRAV